MDRRQQPAPRRKVAAASQVQEWLVVPAAGEAATVALAKQRVMEMTGLPGRDLRMLDPLLSYPSTILGRDRAIVVNLEQVKAIVTTAEVLVRDPSNPRFHPFILDLQARLAVPAQCNTMAGTDKILPFEFKVLEVCLEHTSKCMESETSALESETYPALDKLTSKVSTLNLEHVRQIKSRLIELSGRVQKVRDDLEHLLEDDTDMSEMYLTRKLLFHGFSETFGTVDSDQHASAEQNDEKEEENSDAKNPGYVKPNIDELEMLLEAYFMQVESTLNKLHQLHDYVDDTEDYINIMLDEKQNKMLEMGVMLSIATLVLTAGITVTALFGMNIDIDLMSLPETPEMAKVKNRMFWETTWGTVAGCIVLYLLAIYAGKKTKILQTVLVLCLSDDATEEASDSRFCKVSDQCTMYV